MAYFCLRSANRILTCISAVCSSRLKFVFLRSRAHSEVVVLSISAVSIKVGQVNTQSLTCVRRQQMKIVVTYTVAVITPIPKVPKPTQAADYRPISITPVLSRSLEKYIVRTFIYPALQLQSSALKTSSPSGRPVQQLPRS